MKELGPSKLAIMGGVLVILLLFFVFVTMRISSPELKLLYTDLSAADSSLIVSKLQGAGIAYDVQEQGSQIHVAENDVEAARMMLAQEGLPNGGSMGYEIFDKQSGFGTTNFVQNINQVRALEGELSRTIRSLDPIKTARVHLVLPQRQLFSRDQQPSSASVFIDLHAGSRLKAEQILAVQSLVASAVAEMDVDKVSVIDSAGNLLARGGDTTSESMMSMKSEELRRNYELRLTQSIEDILGRVVGYGRVRANVTADLNFDRVSMNEELYDPATQVVRSSQFVEENSLEREPPSGQVSVQGNLPGIGGDLLADPKPVLEGGRTEEVTNYEISKTIRTTTREVGEVKKLSVAVLVDGKYTTDAEGNRIYEPRTEEELSQIDALVKSAIGFDEDRGDRLEVTNMQFASVDAGDGATITDAFLGFAREDLLDAVEVIAISIMIILIILLIVQPMMGRLLSDGAKSGNENLEAELLAARANNPALAGPDGSTAQISSQSASSSGESEDDQALIDMQSVEGKVKASSVKKVEDIVENYPAETVNVLRGWMSSET